MGDVEPQMEQQGALEKEALCVAGAAQTVKKPLQGVAGQDQIEVCPSAFALLSNRARMDAPMSGPVTPGSPGKGA